VKAEKSTVEKVTVEKSEGVKLELTMDEVKGLYAICLRVGGDPEESARRHTDAFMAAVEEALGKEKYDWGWLGKEYASVEHGMGIAARDYPDDSD
jgi:hypothetical protein